ncbi:Rv3654c family TadE-like protein [Georgenia alba]|uniref:Rv3654c family TadE-like protein n=1 Tax=Georgenia alba TaxID=2233858 RepID=A0ABW2QA27_9MICO
MTRGRTRKAGGGTMDDDPQRGSGTVLGLALIALLLTATLVVVGLARAVHARGVAQTAADLGALAGATALHAGGAAEPCAVAREVVSTNDAELVTCRVAGEDVEVGASVAVVAEGWPVEGRELHARAEARAGPDR